MRSISRIEFAPDLTEQVHQRLLNAICAGELAPGARLTQEELAASLNVSRQPVLQALGLLKKEGFVIEAGRRGLMVAPLNAQAIVHVYQVRSALDAGADGLALKTESPQQTLTAIRQVHAGQLVFPQAARRWIESRTVSGPGDLTPREREVWALVAAGLTNPEIAQRLGLSDNTVKFHVQHLFSKLGVKNRTEAALKYAHRPPGSPR